jgi:hypothetical protein
MTPSPSAAQAASRRSHLLEPSRGPAFLVGEEAGLLRRLTMPANVGQAATGQPVGCPLVGVGSLLEAFGGADVQGAARHRSPVVDIERRSAATTNGGRASSSRRDVDADRPTMRG